MNSCFPGWTSYIISISTAGTIGLWYVESQKGMSPGSAAQSFCTKRCEKTRKAKAKAKVKVKVKVNQGPDVKGMLGLRYLVGLPAKSFSKT